MTTAELPKTTSKTSSERGLDEVLEAAAAELNATTQGARVIDIGPARLDRGRSGTFTTLVTVDTGTLRLGDRLLTGLFLADRADSRVTFPVVDASTWEGSRFELEVDLDAARAASLFRPDDTSDLRLHGSTSDSFVVRSLHARLAETTDLARAEGLLATVLDGRAPAPDLGLLLGPADRRVDVLAGELQRQAGADRRVLVVGSDNASLDRLAVAARRGLGDPPPGRVVRMGVASSPVVGHERSLTLAGACAELAPVAAAQVAALNGPTPAAPALEPPVPSAVPSADAASTADADADTPAVDADTSDADTSDGVAADGGVMTVEACHQALAAADADLARDLAASRAASEAHTAARQAVRALDDARARHRRVDEAVRAVEEATSEAAASAVGVGRLAESNVADLAVAAEVATVRLDRRDAALAELAAAQAGAREVPGRGPVAAADRELGRLRTAHATAERVAVHVQNDRNRLATELARLTGVAVDPPSAIPGPPALAGSPLADSAPMPERDEAAVALAAEFTAAKAELSARSAAALSGAQIVLCTWGQLMGNPAIYGTTYDEVIVEQAASVPAAWVLWAASRSRNTVVLGYALDERSPAAALALAAAPAELHRWVAATLPQLLGADSSDAVRAHPGGLVVE